MLAVFATIKKFLIKIFSVEYLRDSANSLAVFFRVTCVAYLLTDVWVKHHEDVWESMPCLAIWIGVISFFLILFFCDLNSRDVDYFIALSGAFVLNLKRLYNYFFAKIVSFKYYLIKFINAFLSSCKLFFSFWRPLFKKSGYFFKYLKNRFFN